MDFTNVINAIDRLVKNRVGAAAYTRMFIAVVQGVEDTETNTYKISYDGGKTSVTAITITPDVNETVYKKGDSVQVLQLNGDGNTNLYILGKNSDITQKNIDELDSHFITKNTHKVGDTLEFRLNDGSNVVETIKSFGSFIIGATFSVDNSKEVYNYGIKITLSFGQKGTTTYIFDTYQMLGQPWNYKNIRQEFKQKIDEFYCPYLETITLEKFAAAGHESQTEIKDIEISSALLHEANVYTAEFKGSKTGLDFITEKQAGKNNTTLQVLFYKNDIFFASEKCKYYWFRRDESVDSENEHYHRYGGKGWYLLNSIETQTSIDGDKEIPETIVKNNIGNSLQISNEIANQYHNYFKCVVEYGMYTAATEEKEILNLDSTALSFSLTTDSNVITKLDENTVLNIKLDLNDSGNQVNLIKWSYQKDNTGSREYIITEGTEKELNLANAASTEAVRKISNILGLQHTTFYCTLINTSVNPIVTLGEAKLIITRDLSTELTEEIWYYNNGESIVPPTTVDTTNWTTDPSKLGDVSSKYIFAASRMVSPTYEGSFGDIYCYSAHGIGAAAAQLTEFNRLTHNGKDRGLFYGSGYIKTLDTEKQSGKTYYYFNNTTKKFMELTSGFISGVVYYEKFNDDQALYINADYINTGTLRIGDENHEKFFASINNKNVKIGGFTVGETNLSWGNPTTGNKKYVYLGQEGLQLGEKFSISQFGDVSWNSNNSPIRQIYCVNNTASLPVNKEAYNNLPNNSSTAWHKIKSDNDKYYAQSSDGGVTWAGPFLIQGEKGENGKDGEAETIKSVKILYKATTDQIQPNSNDPDWVTTVTAANFNETKQFLWVKQITTYSTNKSTEIIYLTSVWGKDGTSVKIKASAEACTELGDAYIKDGILMIYQGIDEITGEKKFTPAGEIKGPKGDTGIGTANKIYYLLQVEGATPSANTPGWKVEKQPLTEDTPILWQKFCYYYLEPNTTTIPENASPYLTVISILEEIPKRVICAYADTDSFISIKGSSLDCFKINIEGYESDNKLYILTAIAKNDNGEIIERTFGKILDDYQLFYVPTIDTVIDSSKQYYKDKSGTQIIIPSTAKDLKTCFEQVAIQKFTDSDGKVTYSIYDTATGNTGYFGTCEGRYLSTTTCNMIDPNKYSWSYYLTQLNRTNFMENVIDNAKDADGNYIDGIYTVENNNGQNYIGINASAINTGSLKITDGTNTIFNANVSDKKVDIAGWNISAEQISKSGTALYSGAISKNSLVTSGSTSPIRICAGYGISSISNSKFLVLNDGSLYASAASIEGNVTANSGSIGGWNIDKQSLYKNDVGLYTDDNLTTNSLVTSGSTSPIRICAGLPQINSQGQLAEFSVGRISSNGDFTAIKTATDITYFYAEKNENQVSLDITGAPYSISATAVKMKIGKHIEILSLVASQTKVTAASNSIYNVMVSGAPTTTYYISKNAFERFFVLDSKFKVLEDGSLYASAASIEGNINATSGKIGNFEILPQKNSEYLKWYPNNTNNSSWRMNIGGPSNDANNSSPMYSITKENSPYMTMNLAANKLYFSDGSAVNTPKSNKATYELQLLTKNLISNSTSATAADVYPSIISNKLFIGTKEINSNNHKPEVGITIFAQDNQNSDDSELTTRGQLIGSWYTSSGITVTSSRNKKHDIEELDNRYSTLLDNLKPVRFKYNDGVSNRYHTGLILDEMKDAMDTAQIDSSEFAAYCIQDKETGDGGIRYEELIALLIKEVQSLKTQVNVLTEKLNKLEEK